MIDVASDDFIPNSENDEDQEETKSNNYRQGKSISDYSDNIEKAKKFSNSLRSKGTGQAADTAAKNVGKNAAGTAAKSIGKNAAGAAAKNVGKDVAAKAAAKSALAASGVATGGTSLIAALGVEAAKKLKDKFSEIGKKIGQKLGDDKESDKKKRKKKVLIIVLILLAIVFMINGGLFLSNNQMSDDLSSIIKKRETRYNKKLLEFTDSDIDDLIYKDYDMDKPNAQDKDPSYSYVTKDSYSNDYNYFFVSNSSRNKNDNDKNTSYMLSKVKSYLKAEISNFNKVNWLLVDSDGNSSKPKMKDNVNGTQLSIPDPDVYDIELSQYEDMLNPYLQGWIVPYALAVAAQDTDFGDKVLNDMYSPITVKLYMIKKQDRVTTTTNIDSTTVDKDINGNTVSYSSHTTQGPDTKLNDPVAYKYIPKVVHAEGFYSVLDADYSIVKINIKNAPNEVNNTTDGPNTTTTGNTTETKTSYIKTETWYEDLENGDYTDNPYKVSYYNDKDYENLKRKISIVEWFQDFGAGNNTIYPSKSDEQKKYAKDNYGINKGLSYDDLYYGYEQIEKYYSSDVYNGDIGDSGYTMAPNGSFTWPVPILVKEKYTKARAITAPFGDTSIKEHEKGHLGIDISSGGHVSNNVGPDIIAAQSGNVIIARNGNGYGNHVVIKHTDGYYTLYGHMSSIDPSIKVGVSVNAGQVIGKMGTTGISTGVHLHFGVYKLTNGQNFDYKTGAIDPAKFFDDNLNSVGGGSGAPASHKEFISRMAEATKGLHQKYGIYSSICMAQAILESGWGTSGLSAKYNNLFGMKSFDPSQPRVKLKTSENYNDVIYAYFRVYSSYQESIEDYAKNFHNTSTYTRHGVFLANSPEEQAEAIQNSGYATATDSHGNLIYAKMLLDIINSNNLKQYDQ